MTLSFDHTCDLDFGMEWNGMGLSIDMERKGCESSIHDHDID